MLSIKTLYRGRISTFFPKELQDLEFLSLPFHLKWIWLQEMHYMSGIRSPTEFSTWQFLRLRSLSFPYSLVIVAPSSPRTQETVPEPPPDSWLFQPPVQLSSSHPSANCWVKSQGILVLMTEVRMASSTQLRWDHACERSLQIIKSWLDKWRGGYFTTLKLSASYTQQACHRERIISPALRQSISFLYWQHFYFLDPSLLKLSWVQEFRIQRKAQLLIDYPPLQNVKGLAPAPIGCWVSLKMKAVSLPTSLLWQVSSYPFGMSTGHSICCVYND